MGPGLLMACILLGIADEASTPPPLVSGPADPLPAAVQMHFLAYHGDNAYSVTVHEQSCVTPCTLELPPGPAKVHVEGDGVAELQVVIPRRDAQMRVLAPPPSWYLPVGATLIPAGILVGVSMWALAFTCGFGPGTQPCTTTHIVAWPALGLATLITGSVLLGIYNRARPLDANRTEILDASRESGLRFDGLGLALVRDGAAASVALRF